MDDVKLMEVLHRQDHLAGVDGRSPLVELAFRLQDRVKLASSRVLKDDVDLLLIKEEPIHLQNVGMLQVRVDLYLPPQLVDHFFVLQLLLRQHLQSHDMLALPLPRQVDMPVSA